MNFGVQYILLKQVFFVKITQILCFHNVPMLFGDISIVCMGKTGENTKSGSFLQKPLETLV